jgi:hypothetical protein
MIQFIRKTGPENHTDETKRHTTHPKHTISTRFAQSLAKRHTIRTQGIKAASQLKQQLKENPKPRMASIDVQPA